MIVFTHPDCLEQVALEAGGRLDPDTIMSSGSWRAAVAGAGACACACLAGLGAALDGTPAFNGNGTQSLVERDPAIRYVSLHQRPAYPRHRASGGAGYVPERLADGVLAHLGVA